MPIVLHLDYLFGAIDPNEVPRVVIVHFSNVPKFSVFMF